MFTGLIQGLGRVVSIGRGSNQTVLRIGTELASKWGLGDSIAVNGACLTISRLEAQGFSADVMPETWRGTNLSRLAPGDRVNLEPALEVGGRFGGHLVSGHVDGIGRISRIGREHNAILMQIQVSGELSAWIVHKGSVAVNGVSLTVQRLTAGGFMISLIPHTIEGTTLQIAKPGDWVNIETDLLARSLMKQVKAAPSQTGITTAFLAENGFL